MRIYLVRHPKPIVASDTCYGRSDLAVSPQECARVAAPLISTLPQGVPLYSSPLRRCADLARGIADALDCAPIIFDARLAEMDFGAWELRPWSDIARADIDAWVSDIAAYRPGGGESVMQMAQRVCAFYDDLARQRHACAIVVCHAGTIRLSLAYQRGLSVADMATQAARTPHGVAYGEVLAFELRDPE